MGISYSYKISDNGCASSCADKFGCPEGVSPDFIIKRHDTKPSFKVSVSDCDGPIDLSGLVLEVNMWAKGKLKAAIDENDTYFQLANNIGFDQAMIGDIIIMDRVRMPEHMLVTGFDENNKLIQVQRGYNGTTPSDWKKGSLLRIFRVLNAPAVTETVFDDIEQLDGTVLENQIIESLLVYEWQPNDVCLPGCYWLEFKLLKMIDLVLYTPGKTWCGPTHTSDGYFYTGTTATSSSVKLSYDSVNDQFKLPNTVWSGSHHLEDDVFYTGSIHDDGSVYLSRSGVPSEEEICYTASGNMQLSALSVVLSSLADTISNISFIGSDLTPLDFGCTLGDGVEWARRYPCGDAEGFLIKISNSPTVEF